jgi:DNA-binding NarL/FixJ family response regulator
VRIRVAVVDDQALVRGGLAMVLGHQDDSEVVAEAGTGLEAIEVARTHRPDVILMDIRMPEMDGLEATARIVEEADWPVRVLIRRPSNPTRTSTGHFAPVPAASCSRTSHPRSSPSPCARWPTEERCSPPSITRRLIGQFAQRLAVDTAVSGRLERLTDREREVLAVIARGSSNAEISDELFIGAATVKSHVSSILTKLGLRDRAQLVVFAYESGLIEAGERDIGH